MDPTCFHLTIFLEKKNPACCLLKAKYLLSWWKEVLKLNIVIWRENLCASENANCHQPLFLEGSQLNFSSPKKSSNAVQYKIHSINPVKVLQSPDWRTLIGYLRSVDQFANLVLHRTIERIHVGSEYGDIPRGIFIVRGENVVSMFIINAQGRKIYT